MNILITSAHYHLSDKYGSEASWGVEIIKQYIKAGHKVYAIAGVAELINPLPEGITLYYLSKQRAKNSLLEIIKKAFYPFYSYYFARKIFFKLKGDIQLVHHIAPTGPVSYDLFFIFRPKNLKAKFLIGPAMLPGEEGGYKSLALMLGSKSYFSVMLVYPLVRLSFFMLKKLSKLTFQKADKIIAVTGESKKFYANLVGNSSNITVIPVGIDLGKFRRDIQKFKQTSKETIVVLSVSNLIKRKGLDLLIEAAYLLKSKYGSSKFKIVIVGTGDQEEILKRQAESRGVRDVVEFAGFVENTKIQNYYAMADIFCSPTRYEPYGVTLLEAMASGIPVVASDVNSVKEIVGDAGFCFKKDDCQELKAALERLILDKDMRNSMEALAETRVKKYFVWNKITREYLELVVV